MQQEQVPIAPKVLAQVSPRVVIASKDPRDSSTTSEESSPSPLPHTIYIVRHGDRYDYANPELWSKLASDPQLCASDPPLSTLGQLQSRNTASFLKRDIFRDASLFAPLAAGTASPGRQITLLSSCYTRVLQTAVPLSLSCPSFVSYEGSRGGEADAGDVVAPKESLTIKVEMGLMECGHYHKTVPPPALRAVYFPQIDLSYVPVYSLSDLDGPSPQSSLEPPTPFYPAPLSKQHNLESHASYFSRIARFSRGLDYRLSRSPPSVRDGGVTVLYTHAAGLSVAAALSGIGIRGDDGRTLESLGVLPPCGVVKLVKVFQGGNGGDEGEDGGCSSASDMCWKVVEGFGNRDNSYAFVGIEGGTKVGELAATKPWGFDNAKHTHDWNEALKKEFGV